MFLLVGNADYCDWLLLQQYRAFAAYPPTVFRSISLLSLRWLKELEPAPLPALFDEKADFAVHAVHRDLIILDNAFGVFDPEGIDTAKGLSGFLDCLPTGVVKAVWRLRDDLDTADDRYETPPSENKFGSRLGNGAIAGAMRDQAVRARGRMVADPVVPRDVLRLLALRAV